MDSYMKLQTDLKNRIERAQSNFKKSPKDRLASADYISTRLDILEKLWAEFSLTHTQIVQECDEKLVSSSTYVSTGMYEVTEELFVEYMYELKSALRNVKATTLSSVCSSGSGSFTTAIQSKTSDLIRLPKISIPSFSGKYSEWISFRDLFVSLIHKNESLDNVQKLHYLKGHLTGEAEQLLRHVQITQDNYFTCWNQLEKRYNNKKYLSNCILKRLLSQKNIVIESASALKELLDTSNECLYSLRNLGIDISTWDIIVVDIICLKLDSESRKQWKLRVSESSDDLPTLKQFQDFLETRFRALEFVDPKLSKDNYTHKSPNVPVSAHPRVHHVIDVSCTYCSEGHKLCYCKSFAKVEVDTQRDFIQSNNLCFNCLGSGHNAFSCRLPTRCRICKRKHHSLLHPKIINNSTDFKVIASQSVENNVATHTTTVASTGDDHPSSATACVSTSRSQVLLATALVSSQSKSGSGVTLRCLLDQGSQTSFITKSAVQLLGLKEIPHKSKLSGLGGDGRKTMASKSVVNVKIASLLDPEFEVEFHAFVLGKLTSALPDTRVDVQLWSELSNLELADPPFYVPGNVDMLLGADIYGQLLLDGIIKVPLGAPIAQRTTLGWILSGPIHADESGLHKTISVNHIHIDENGFLKKHLELEADSFVTDPKLHYTDKEMKCQKIVAATTNRDSRGRCGVKEQLSQEVNLKSQISKVNLGLRNDSVVKSLELTWDRSSDEVEYSVQLPPLKVPVTKRSGISNSSLFPPVITTAEVFIQTFWLTEIVCNNKVLPQLQKDCLCYRRKLNGLTRMPRWTTDTANNEAPKLQGLCDVSNEEVAAKVYAKTVEMLSCLIRRPKRWKTFVTDRVSEFRTTIEPKQWSHVSSNEIPRDGASQETQQLGDELLWREGPERLKQKNVNYKKVVHKIISSEDMIKKVCLINTCNVNDGGIEDFGYSLISKFSKLRKLIRVVAFCKRLGKRARKEVVCQWLISEEIQESLMTFIKFVQDKHFEAELANLKEKEKISMKRKLTSLNTWVGEAGVFRVSRRLDHEVFSEEIKFSWISYPQLEELIVNLSVRVGWILQAPSILEPQ